MRKLALGLAAAATLLTASVPAMAQVEFYAGPGGFGIVGAPYYAYGPGYGYSPGYYGYRPGYYDYYGGPYVGPGWRYRRWRYW